MIHTINSLIENRDVEQTFQPLNDLVRVLCQQQTEPCSQQSTKSPDNQPFKNKNLHYAARGCTHRAQDGNIAMFLHDNHNQRRGDVKGCNQNNDSQDNKEAKLL